jgi:4'-phosphopantetheinyl transferase
VWTADVRDHVPAELTVALSPDERDRAARYRVDDARDRFIVRRALLRRILGSYLDVPAATIQFDATCRHCQHPTHGKPAVARSGDQAPLDFSVSGSKTALFYAVSTALEVGVDVEAVRPDLDLRTLAPACLTPEEQGALAALDEAQRPAGFFHAWATKEAHLKVLGWGLAVELQQVEVEVDPDKPAAVLRSPLGAGQFVQELRPGPGWAAVVAASSTPDDVRLHRVSRK